MIQARLFDITDFWRAERAAVFLLHGFRCLVQWAWIVHCSGRGPAPSPEGREVAYA